MSKLLDELRKKYPTAKDAIRALGLDDAVLKSLPKLAYDGAANMMPTRLEYLAIDRTAKAINPLLMAMDAKGKEVTVDYAQLFKGLTTKNFKQRKPLIMDGIKKLIKGKTIAKDASVEHLAHLLDQFEHTPEPKSLDESVSKEQHNAMEAAAHGHSNLGIPKKVGEEFEQKDKGKSFDMKDWAMRHGVGEDAMEELRKSMDEMPENALDEEGENVEIEVEEGEDGEIEEEEAEDKIEEEEGEDKKAKDAKGKDSKHGKDNKGKGAMDKKFVTVDQMEKALKSQAAGMRKNAQEAAEAREFCRPYAGELPMGLDSAEKILRATAVIQGIEDAETIHPSALKTLIKTVGSRTESQTNGARADHLATDSVNTRNSTARWPDANRIGNV